jgi:hypothetical protein
MALRKILLPGSVSIRRQFLHSRILHSVIALYGVQASTHALPLLTFPYLARVLGPTGWGSVLFAQVIGIVITCVVEYGFDISASRETSIHRDDPDRLSELISGVLGAKAFLAIVCVAATVLSRKFVQNVAPSPARFSGRVPAGASVKVSTCSGFSRALNGCDWRVSWKWEAQFLLP